MKREKLEEYGVNFENMNYPNGEMSIIVQQLPTLKKDIDDNNEFMVYPDIYRPRTNSVWSCICSGDGIDISTEESKREYIMHLKDSAERLKIMSILLSEQAKELENFGEIRTSLYYPEETD
jgi:hypothetical protein